MEARAQTAFLKISVFLVWGIGLIVYWSSLWHGDAYGRFGADLPDATQFAVSSARAGLPFIVAALLSAVLIWQIFRPGPRRVLVAAWLLCVAIGYASLVMVAVTLPMVTMCGEFVPPAARNAEGEKVAIASCLR